MIIELVLVSTMSWQITSYRSVPAQTDSTPFNTSTGARTNSAICAISQDELGKQIHYGDYLFIEIPAKPELSRYCWVQDTMNKRMKHSVDLWVPTKEQEKKIGVRKGLVYRLTSPGEIMKRRTVPTEMMPQVMKTFGDIQQRNPNGNETRIWNIAAELVWLIQKVDTKLQLLQLNLVNY